MTVRLTPRKKENLKSLCESILKAKSNLIEIVAKVIGKIVSCFPMVLYGPLYYRSLEYDKTEALKNSKGNFKAVISLSQCPKSELKWWMKNIDKSFKPISSKGYDMIITTDASKLGWGAVCDNHATNGIWTEREKHFTINYLEMLAVFFGLKCFASCNLNSHIRVMCDNTTTCNSISVTQNGNGTCRGNSNTTRLANAALVPQSYEHVETKTDTIEAQQNVVNVAWSAQCISPITPQATSVSLPLARDYLKLSKPAQEIITASWRSGTLKQYRGYLQQWENYCAEQKINFYEPGVENVAEFLTKLYLSGIGYSALNTARSALSSILFLKGNTPIGQHPMICRLLKGVFEMRPALPEYTVIWDIGIVLKYLQTLHPPVSLSLKDLSLKVTTLLCILSGQRCQTIHEIDIQFIQKVDKMYRISIQTKLKQTKPNKHLKALEFQEYLPDKSLCIFEYLTEYLSRTKALRGENTSLLISYMKPHKAISKDTVSRWVKTILRAAGVNVQVFTAHSCRSASTSAAKAVGLSLTSILKFAGWSNSQTFAKYYDNLIVSNDEDNFGTSLLNKFDKS
eukprot:gene20746-22775_t